MTTTCTKPTQTSTPPALTIAMSPNKGRCQNCHKGFHATKNCRAPGGAKEGVPYPDQEKKQSTATAAATWEKPSHLFLAYASREENSNASLDTLLTSHSTLDHLILDSGCSIHMSPCQDWFILGTLKKLHHSYSIHVANGQELKATMGGTLQVNLLVNGKLLEGKFSNTLLIPELSTTLISIRNLTGSHHQVIFKDDWAEVITKSTSKLVAKAILGHGGIYIIQTHQSPEHSTHLTNSMNINIFHC